LAPPSLWTSGRLDVWALLAKRLFGIPMSDWAMVGRWVGHFASGQFMHKSIAKAVPVRHERFIHYSTGIAYAALLIVMQGVAWMRAPTLVV
jgi:hypothetical protein